MRNVVLYLAISIDGYLADVHGGVDWLGGDGSEPDAAGSYPSFYETVDTIIMGWNTYHQIVTELSADNWPYQGCLSYVVTHREEKERDGICFWDGDLSALVDRLKKQRGRDIWICGGASVAGQLMKEGYIDRLWLSVIPTVLGSGIRLFPELVEEMPMTLVRTESYNGIVDLVYERRTEAETKIQNRG